MKILKYSLCLILLSVIVLSLSGCKAIEKKLFPYAGTAEKMRDSVMDGFTERNAGTLKELFCDKVKETHDLDEEIQAAFEFIKGNIVSYDETVWDSSGETVTDGKTVLLDQSIRVEDVLTDLDNEYRIFFGYYLVNDDHTDRIGVYYITIVDSKNEESYDIGGL